MIFFSDSDVEEKEEEEMFQIYGIPKQPMTIRKALKRNDIEYIRQLLSNNQYASALQSGDNENDNDPFYRSAVLGRIEIMKLLLDEKVSDVYSGGTLVTPLWAAASHNQVESCTLLIERGAQVDSGSEWGSTPLLAACERNNLEVARLLIKHGADVNIGDDPSGTTPLEAAVIENYTDIVRLLLDSGCDLDDFETYLISVSRRDGRSCEESKQMISAELVDRKMREVFDSFISHHIEYQLYKDMVYSICFHSNLKISKPHVGWERASAFRDKYYFDEIFFYLHAYVGTNFTSSRNFSVLIETANDRNNACILMTVLTTRLKLFLKPI